MRCLPTLDTHVQDFYTAKFKASLLGRSDADKANVLNYQSAVAFAADPKQLHVIANAIDSVDPTLFLDDPFTKGAFASLVFVLVSKDAAVTSKKTRALLKRIINQTGQRNDFGRSIALCALAAAS